MKIISYLTLSFFISSYTFAAIEITTENQCAVFTNLDKNGCYTISEDGCTMSYSPDPCKVQKK